jgi:ketosteroid isomerase-like protein
MQTPFQVVRDFYDHLARGDFAAILSLMAEDIEWTEAERFPYYSGTWHGPQAVLNNLLIPLSRDWTDFAAKAHEYIVEGNRVVALGTYSGTYKATGKSTTADFANIWTVRASKLQSFHMHTDTAKVLEAMTK